MLEKAKKANRKTPKALESRPELRPDVWGYWDGFFTLSAARQANQTGEQPLTVTETLSYCDLVGIPRGESASKFLRLMQAMDRVYLTHHRKVLERSFKNKGKP